MRMDPGETTGEEVKRKKNVLKKIQHGLSAD